MADEDNWQEEWYKSKQIQITACASINGFRISLVVHIDNASSCIDGSTYNGTFFSCIHR